MALSAGFVIACISDDEGFAAKVYDYLLASLERQAEFEDGKQLHLDREFFMLAENEILVSNNANVPRGMIKWILESFLKQDKEKFKDYGVIELGDSLTIGRILHPSKMDMLTCEICGFFTPHEGEVETHRMTHFGI